MHRGTTRFTLEGCKAAGFVFPSPSGVRRYYREHPELPPGERVLGQMLVAEKQGDYFLCLAGTRDVEAVPIVRPKAVSLEVAQKEGGFVPIDDLPSNTATEAREYIRELQLLAAAARGGLGGTSGTPTTGSPGGGTPNPTGPRGASSPVAPWSSREQMFAQRVLVSLLNDGGLSIETFSRGLWSAFGPDAWVSLGLNQLFGRLGDALFGGSAPDDNSSIGEWASHALAQQAFQALAPQFAESLVNLSADTLLNHLDRALGGAGDQSMAPEGKAELGALRVGDTDGEGNAILAGSPDVFVNGRPAARAASPGGQKGAAASPGDPVALKGVSVSASGAATVLLNGQMGGRETSASCAAVFPSGSPDVFYGGAAGGPVPALTVAGVGASERKRARQQVELDLKTRIANHMYGEGDLPAGVDNVTTEYAARYPQLAFLDLINGLLEDSGSGLKAGIFRVTIDGEERLLLVFQGTEGGFLDWLTNFGHTLYIPKQYQLAAELANQLKGIAEREGISLEVFGHSLGGGLAAYASIMSGVPGQVLNAAGWQLPTMIKLLLSGKYQNRDLVTQFETVNDILTSGAIGLLAGRRWSDRVFSIEVHVNSDGVALGLLAGIGVEYHYTYEVPGSLSQGNLPTAAS